MTTITTMHTETGSPGCDPAQNPTLILAQWFSPGYPLGSFTYSHGLEAAIGAGWVTTAGDLAQWLDDVLRFGSGRSDAILIRLAHATADTKSLLDLDAEARAFLAARERVREADRQGRAFAQVTALVWGCDLPDVLLPLTTGYAARQLGIDAHDLVPYYLQAFCANLVAAAQRLMPLGQSDAQAVIAGLQHAVTEVAADSDAKGLDDIHSIAFLSDIAAMQHETLAPRLFQS